MNEFKVELLLGVSHKQHKFTIICFKRNAFITRTNIKRWPACFTCCPTFVCDVFSTQSTFYNQHNRNSSSSGNNELLTFVPIASFSKESNSLRSQWNHIQHTKQSRRHWGALVGLAPPNNAPSPPKLKYETLYISGIFVKFECQAPLHKRQAPSYQRKAPLLTAFWRRFWYEMLACSAKVQQNQFIGIWQKHSAHKSRLSTLLYVSYLILRWPREAAVDERHPVLLVQRRKNHRRQRAVGRDLVGFWQMSVCEARYMSGFCFRRRTVLPR